MIRLKKIIQFAVPTLAAAGAIANVLPEDGQKGVVVESDGILDGIKEIISNIGDRQQYTLAAHSSHASHGSHGSNGSHGSHRSSAAGVTMLPESMRSPDESVSTRNEASTPRSSILPSSPAITKAKKLKILPGNSACNIRGPMTIAI